MNQNLNNNDTFLFTSESVGEGHPGINISNIE
jgi:S-adenosylmethionine synthetase